MENLHASNRSVIDFSYVAVCLFFSSLFLFCIVRIRRRHKVHVRCISSMMSFLCIILYTTSMNPVCNQ